MPHIADEGDDPKTHTATYFSPFNDETSQVTNSLEQTLDMSASDTKMYCKKCFESLTFRHVVNIALIACFTYICALNIRRYNQMNIVVVESSRSTLGVIYPSITLCPPYSDKHVLSKNSSKKNLTEQYENLINMSHIKKNVVSISQPYVTKNG